MSWAYSIPRADLEKYLISLKETVDENETQRDLAMRVIRKKVQDLPEDFRSHFAKLQAVPLMSAQEVEDGKKVYEMADLSALQKLFLAFGITYLEVCQNHLFTLGVKNVFQMNEEEILKTLEEKEISLHPFLISQYSSFLKKNDKPSFM